EGGGGSGEGGAGGPKDERAEIWAPRVEKEAPRRTAPVILSRNYIQRRKAGRPRLEYSAIHMMSEPHPRLSSMTCSLMVNSPWRSNARGPRPRTFSLPPNGWTGPWDKPELF